MSAVFLWCVKNPLFAATILACAALLGGVTYTSAGWVDEHDAYNDKQLELQTAQTELERAQRNEHDLQARVEDQNEAVRKLAVQCSARAAAANQEAMVIIQTAKIPASASVDANNTNQYLQQLRSSP